LGSTSQAEPACDVVFRAILAPPSDGTRALSVVAENVSAHGVEFELPDRCPSGSVDFEGLPAGFDYYRTCNAGACPGPRQPQRVSLDPGGRRQVALARVDMTASICNPALAPGYYQVRPVLPLMGIAACAEAAALDLRGATPAPPITHIVRTEPLPSKPAPSPSPPPPPSPPAPIDPTYGCTTAADCVLSCPTPPGCCGWPCGCTNAIRRDHADAFAASYAKTCTRAPHCPSVDCAYQLAVGATCRNGRCAAATTPSQM
jgi:hypothetical protein